MARVSSFWKKIGNTIEPVFTGGVNILLRGTNRYLNFGSEDGSDGYGFRDNAGTIEYKSDGGSWAAVGSGGAGGISDGDKGDITVTDSGATWTINDEAVTLAKMAHVPTNRILGRSTAGTGDPEALADGAVRDIIGLATTDSPQFAGVNIGHATDTTITRTAAGTIAVEGNVIYRAGGTDVPVTDGGTGASTAAGARTNLGAAPTASPTLTGTTTVDRIDYDRSVPNRITATSVTSSYNFDWSAAREWDITMSGNTTFTFSNAIAGESINVIIRRSAAANFTMPTLEYMDNVDGTTAPAQLTATSSILRGVITYDGTEYIASFAGNYAVYA